MVFSVYLLFAYDSAIKDYEDIRSISHLVCLVSLLPERSCSCKGFYNGGRGRHSDLPPPLPVGRLSRTVGYTVSYCVLVTCCSSAIIALTKFNTVHAAHARVVAVPKLSRVRISIRPQVAQLRWQYIFQSQCNHKWKKHQHDNKKPSLVYHYSSGRTGRVSQIFAIWSFNWHCTIIDVSHTIRRKTYLGSKKIVNFKQCRYKKSLPVFCAPCRVVSLYLYKQGTYKDTKRPHDRVHKMLAEIFSTTMLLGGCQDWVLLLGALILWLSF